MLTTANLGLKKPELTEYADIAIPNENMDIIDSAVAQKVDKVTGKQLSTEDYTTAEKTKLSGIPADANHYVHPNHTGDVTSNGDGITSIALGVIVNADINNSAAIDATKIANGTVSNTEFQYLDGVTSAVQTQLNSKAPLSSPTFTGTVTLSQDPTLALQAATKQYADTKLAASSYTAADVKTKLLTVDGAGSGVDADTLDGLHGSSFALTPVTGTYTGDGALNRDIALPFTPSAVILGTRAGLSGSWQNGLALSGFPVGSVSNPAAKVFELGTNKMTVHYDSTQSMAGNASGTLYHYIAFP